LTISLVVDTVRPCFAHNYF